MLPSSTKSTHLNLPRIDQAFMKLEGEAMHPKVFISYSWSSPAHQQLVKTWADRLVADGVEVIFDLYDLKEGQDKYAFMERMVTDKAVTHALVICDKKYAEKANLRAAGVGTESQIISQEIYEKVDQSKFIPIVCEFDDEDNPQLPVFLKSRIWINFSSPEAENENWEQLIRLLYGKPQHIKPKLGKIPTYITSDVAEPASESLAKYKTLKHAILNDKKGIGAYRKDFLNSCISYADMLRVRVQPNVSSMGEKVLEDAKKLKVIRDHLVDWVLLESASASEEEFSETLIELLEKLRELKTRPAEVTSWNDNWFDAHAVFVYETFLYIVAALLKNKSYKILHEVYTTHYLLPGNEGRSHNPFDKFDSFYGTSDVLQHVLTPGNGRTYLSPTAELLKRHADRSDLPFSDILQADLLTFLMSCLIDGTRWYPQTLYYASYGTQYPLFIKAAQHKSYAKLSIITGETNADKLRTKVKEGFARLRVKDWYDFRFGDGFWVFLNMDNLDTLKS